MSKFSMPAEVAALQKPQQDAILSVLIKAGLLNAAGERMDITADNMPDLHKAVFTSALKSMGLEPNLELFNLGGSLGSILGKLRCPAARIAEAAAVVACDALDNPIAVAACKAAAHEAANAQC